VVGEATFSATLDAFFYNSNQGFKAVTQLNWSWISDVSATTTATVLLNSNGSTLNGGTTTYADLIFTPTNFGDTSQVATASTLNRKCGITGKATATATGDQNLIGTDGQLHNAWHGLRTPPPIDKTLPNCPKPHFVATGDYGDYTTDGGTLSLNGAQDVSFDGSSSAEGDYPITSYSWDDDGDVFSNDVTGDEWFEPGSYTVSLTVTDDDDISATASADITVTDNTVPDSLYQDNGDGNPDDGTTCYDVYLVWDDGSEDYLFSTCCSDTKAECSEY
jgi:hypothetical protein